MKKLDQLYNKYINISSLSNFTDEELVKYTGDLIEISYDLKRQAGIEKVINLTNNLEKDIKAPFKAIIYYHISVGWGYLSKFKRKTFEDVWAWDNFEVENEILNLRYAYKYFDNEKNTVDLFCRICTNLGCHLNRMGRFVEALRYWNEALEAKPKFYMAMANKAEGLYYHSVNTLYNDIEKMLFTKFAYEMFKESYDKDLEHEQMKKYYSQCIELIEEHFPELIKNEINLNYNFENCTEEEKKYRLWCLENYLFLNPLNDISNKHTICVFDTVYLPSMQLSIKQGMSYHNFFNQIKQEFLTVRFLYYESLDHKTYSDKHYSDDKSISLDTLDYSCNSIYIEKKKIVFKGAYSIFDKIAYFINYYMNFNDKSSKNIYFSNIWYSNLTKKHGLRSELVNKDNLMLRALYWLSKDFYEKKEDYQDTIEPDAKELVNIRNHIEHKSFRVQEISMNINDFNNNMPSTIQDSLALSISLKDLDKKTIKMLKLAREAIIYLSFFVYWEERKRKSVRPVINQNTN